MGLPTKPLKINEDKLQEFEDKLNADPTGETWNELYKEYIKLIYNYVCN